MNRSLEKIGFSITAAALIAMAIAWFFVWLTELHWTYALQILFAGLCVITMGLLVSAIGGALGLIASVGKRFLRNGKDRGSG